MREAIKRSVVLASLLAVVALSAACGDNPVGPCDVMEGSALTGTASAQHPKGTGTAASTCQGGKAAR